MVFLACDHAGFKLKKVIKEFLIKQGYEVEDLGPSTYNSEDDYPDFVIPAAEKVAESPEENKAIVVGRSGQGEAIAANKVKGVRSTVFCGSNLQIPRLERLHNNANVLALGADFVSEENAKKAVEIFLETEFSQRPRHKRRLAKISTYEG